jgi:hypothetical protein
MTDRKLMQQALNALKVMRPACFAETTLKAADTAINALRDRLAQPELVQVSPLEFVTAVLEKEHLIGKPIMWAQWPNREKNGG